MALKTKSVFSVAHVAMNPQNGLADALVAANGIRLWKRRLQLRLK